MQPRYPGRMANLVQKLRDRNKALVAKDKKHETEALSHLVALGGGVVGALAIKAIPMIVPKTHQGADGPALIGTVMLVDALSLYAGSPEFDAFAYSFEGKVSGDLFERAMGWRPALGT